MAHNDYFLEEIRARADIVEVVSDYVKLELKGKNHLGLCPFHQEKTPSFTVSRDKQLYYCFGCGAGGDIFNFLMEIENLPFIEAAKILANRYGVPIPEREPTTKQRAEDELREQLFQIHEWTAKFYSYLLCDHAQGKEALAYFEKRGFTRATIEKFRLGYAPQGWTALFHFLQKKGYSKEILEKSGLVLPGKSSGDYDRFRDRAMFTIMNQRGQPIGFGGRVMKTGETPKYLNSPETLLFLKSNNLYGLNFARERMRQTKQAIMMEGYTDVITAHQYGIENAVASLGTALTEEQAKLLARYVDEVYISYDADTAGQNATLRGLDILKEAGLMVKVIRLTDDFDPDQLIREQGPDAFIQYMEKAVSLIDFKFDQIIAKYDLTNPDGKVKAVEELLPLFLNIDNAIEKDYLEEQIVQHVKVSRQALQEELANFMEEKSKIKDKSDKKWHTKEETRKNPTNQRIDSNVDPKVRAFEERFVNAILRLPRMIGQICSAVVPEILQVPDCRAIFGQIHAYYLQYADTKDFSNLTTNELLDGFSDEKLKQQALYFSFLYPEHEVTENYLTEGLKKLKEYQKAMEMETILREIRQIKTHGKLPDLNQVLIRYHRMLHHDNGKGGC